MALANATIPLLDPLASAIFAVLDPILNQIRLAVGGLFGLYMLFFIYRIYATQQEKKVLQQIRADISAIHSRLDTVGIPPVPNQPRARLHRKLAKRARADLRGEH
ncbi:hypothetical protein HYU19_05685 [Candidatus Woesearchaeota archaeon]|nr:hypothetical protein [Candidatus Woesearchaeota archaeon]